jgi:hypothetical protein
MDADPRLQHYVDAERDARLRLARFKAKLYAAPQNASPASSRRLGELRRRWELTMVRLHEARARARAQAR